MEILNKIQNPSFSIYDASAGSGKTYTLVKEYLKIVLTSKRNDAYRNILAITFTNKAVHEMKSRIVDNLFEFSKDNTNEKANELLNDIALDTQLSVSKIKTKAKIIIKHMIHNYAAFDILTIDKFTHKVIRAFAHDLNLPITFEVTLDTDQLLNEAIDAIIAKAGEDSQLTNLLVDFTIEKTDDDKSWDISREIFEISKLIFSENNRKEISLLNSKTIPDFIEIKNKIIKAAKNLEVQNQKSAKSAIDLINTNKIDIKSFSRGTFPNHLASIRDGKYNPKNKKFNKEEDISINKSSIDRITIESIIPELLLTLKEIYLKYEEIDFYKAFLKNINPLSLLNTVSNELTKIQKEQNLLSIAEFNTLIYNQIQEQPAPFIYERLGERYHHFFIDEFQDTSELQWKNLIPLIDNALSSEFETGEKGTLMIVGDPKQSIYRWRGGKAEQFIALSKEENPFHNPDKQLFHLDTNYRSYSKIIDFNNDFFKFLSEKFDDLDYKDLYQNHSHQLHNPRVGGYFSLTFLDENDKLDQSIVFNEELDKNDQYCIATVQKIEEIISKGYQYKDIAILTRKRSQGILIANYLTKQNIPLISSETLLIQNATEVQFVINVLKYIKNKSDKESKANFLLYIASTHSEVNDPNDFISEGLKKGNESDLENFLLKFDISISFDNLRKKSLYETVELIITLIIKEKNNQSYIQYFLDLILERDYHKQAGVSDFLTFWEANSTKYNIPSPEGNNAIKILTIHKSKGLEFPVVIFPFAEEDYERKPKDKIWLNSNETNFGLTKVLVDNNKAITGFGENALQTYNQQKQEELLDNINILYVALTRAEEQFYIISKIIQPKNDGEYPYNMASFFINYLINKTIFNPSNLIYEFGNSEKLSKIEEYQNISKSILQVSQRFDINNLKIAQKESLLWGSHHQEAIEYGNIIHEILSYINCKEDINLAISKSLELGLITVYQKKAVNDTIFEIINHKELEPFFSNGNIVYNEKTILQKDEKAIKPDRIVITQKEEVLLLDYKTGMPQEKYKFQLDNYQSVLEKMNFKVTKKALVYIGEKIKIIEL